MLPNCTFVLSILLMFFLFNFRAFDRIINFLNDVVFTTSVLISVVIRSTNGNTDDYNSYVKKVKECERLWVADCGCVGSLALLVDGTHGLLAVFIGDKGWECSVDGGC